MEAQDIRAALDRRYSQNATAQRRNEQWVIIHEARSGASFDGNRRQCDYLAINTYKGRGLQLIGHEIKVSTADWKRELADPDKAELFARHCRRWWIVTPSDLAQKIKHEVPPTWGLMSVSDAGRITEINDAPAREPVDVSDWWWIGWLAQLDRAEKRGVEAEVSRRVSEQLEGARAQWESSAQYRRERQSERTEKIEEMAGALREATGIDLAHVWSYQMERLAALWELAHSGQELDKVAARLRESADLLDALVGDPSD